jgi:pilus assembly protein CpaB
MEKAGLALAGLVLGVALSTAALREADREEHEGWRLHPVIVAADSIKAGTKITYDMISQRPIPERFVLQSMVMPDQAAQLVGQPTLVPLEAGDVLFWSQLPAGVTDEQCRRVCDAVASGGKR